MEKKNRLFRDGFQVIFLTHLILTKHRREDITQTLFSGTGFTICACSSAG